MFTMIGGPKLENGGFDVGLHIFHHYYFATFFHIFM